MGWQDAPVLGAEPSSNTSAGGGWQSAPLVEMPSQNVAAESNRSLGGFAGNVGKSGINTVKGVANAVLHPLDTATTLVDIGAGALQKALPQGVVDFVNKFDSDPEAAKRAAKVASAVGGAYADRYGSIEGIKKTLYEDPVGAAADLSTILSLGAGAIRQAPAIAAGALKVANAPEMAATVARAAPAAAEIAAPVAELGSAINPMNAVPLQTAGKLVAKGGNYLANVVNPKAATVLAATEGKAAEIINALRNSPREFTPGYSPTAAELTTDLNLTKFPAAQAEWSRQATTPYYQRNIEQNAALLAPLNVEKTTIPMSEARRAGVTAPMYEKALAPKPSNFFPETSAIKSTAETKLMEIDSNISKLIQDNPSNPDLVTQLQAVQKGMRDAKGKLYTEPKQISSVSEGIGKALDTVKDKFVRSELTSIKDAVYDAIPEYAAAQKKFAELSKPINQAEIADYFRSKLASSVEAENKLTPAQFANALENVPGTVKSSTGLTRVEDLNKVLEPAQIKILNQIKSDIANKAKMQQQAAAGGKGFDALEAAQLPKAPHIFSKAVSIANDILNRLQGKIDRKMAMELAVSMLDPETAALSIEKALARQKGIDRVGKDISAVGSGVKNALRSQQALGAGQINNALAE